MSEPTLAPREGRVRGTIRGIAFDSCDAAQQQGDLLGWYFRNGGYDEVHGPYPLADLEAWVDAGYFTGDELCWHGVAGTAVAMRTALRDSRGASVHGSVDDANKRGSAVRAGSAVADETQRSEASDTPPDGWYCDDTTSVRLFHP